MLDAYLRWYRDVRLKSGLCYKSPMQYRRDLGLIAKSQTVQDFRRSPKCRLSYCQIHQESLHHCPFRMFSISAFTTATSCSRA